MATHPISLLARIDVQHSPAYAMLTNAETAATLMDLCTPISTWKATTWELLTTLPCASSAKFWADQYVVPTHLDTLQPSGRDEILPT
jgi:hypothetical protein